MFIRATTLCCLFLLLVSSAAFAQNDQTIRIMTWNILNYTRSTSAMRDFHYARVLRHVQPAIVVTQGNAATVHDDLRGFQDAMQAMNNRPTGGVGFVNGPDLDATCYFDPTQVKIVGQNYIPTEFRNIAEYRFAVLETQDTFRVFTCDLKEGSSAEDQAHRLGEVQAILRRMDTLIEQARRTGSGDTLFVVAGDLNVYSSDEVAYLALTVPNLASPHQALVVDPIGRPGVWSENEAFADIHTNSTRMRSFGGGTVGGLGQRFDQILGSSAMMEHYVEGSYSAFGNDGQHFADSINRLPNLVVVDSVAESLHTASDHLPVFADFVFRRTSSAVREGTAHRFAVLSISPQPASDRITLRIRSATAGRLRLQLVDATGESLLERSDIMVTEGEQTLEIDVRALPAGVYGYSVTTASESASGKVLIVR